MGYISPSIIKYLEPLTRDLLTARFADNIFNEDHFPALGEELKYHAESQKINWDAKGIANEDPRTQESELQILRILNLQNITNNLPDAFTAGKDITKSYIPVRNVPERIEVPKKTIQLSSSGKSGKSTAIPTGAASRKRNRKGKETPSRLASATQPPVERSKVDRDDPPPASTVHTFSDAGTSERPDGIVLGNSEPSRGIQEISINYLDSGETYDCKIQLSTYTSLNQDN